MPSTVILGTARTPFGKMGGTLSSLDATDLGGHAIEAALERSGVDPEQVEQVVFGQVLQAGQGQIPSRQAQIKGGIPKEVPSETINKVCASGMRSLGIADMAIRAGDTEVAVTGGMESMSQAPHLLPGARFGYRMGHVETIDAMVHDGLTNPFTEKQMINEASEVSNELEITRADMDQFAERSHRLAAEATDAGRLADEIVGVTVKSRKGETHDRGRRGDPRRDHGRDARRAAGDRRRGRHPHRRQRARASTTAPARSSSPPRSGPRRKAARRSPGSSPTAPSPTTSPTWRKLRPTPPSRRWRRSARAPRTSTSGRSTRPSPRSRSTRCGCSASTRTRSTSTAARSPSATRSAPPAPASSAALVHELGRRGGGLGVAAICSGGGQGDAIVIEVSGSARRREATRRAAAFFDLDKTLMAGSCGMQFARVATRHGIVGRRQLASWGFEHLRYRLRGTTDERTDRGARRSPAS